MTEIVVGKARVFHGDCREVLRGLPDNSIDSVVTDPPYELGFMGKKWDSSGIAYDVSVWVECLRVLKPGGHVLAFGGSRTFHRMAVAIEDAGFEIRDSIAWMYGSGFPKSLDVSKAIDKSKGKNRERQLEFTAWMRASGITGEQINNVTGTAMASHYLTEKSQPAIATADLFDLLRPLLPPVPEHIERLVAERTGIEWTEYKNRQIIAKGYRVDAKTSAVPISGATPDGHYDITAAHTSEAKQWEGWGTALKPAFEPIVVGRKPFAKGSTVAANVLEHGVGGLNIDASRVAADMSEFVSATGKPRSGMGHAHGFAMGDGYGGENANPPNALGRWPANVILDEYSAGLLDEQSGVLTSGARNPVTRNSPVTTNVTSFKSGLDGKPDSYTADKSSGGASRFFYCAKASKRDRNEGLDGLEDTLGGSMNGAWYREGKPTNHPVRKNFHPTVKPTALMRYLIKLVTPAGGTVLDPFTGSGSTGKAALLDGYKFLGVELTEEYLPIIERRLRWAIEQEGETDGTLF